MSVCVFAVFSELNNIDFTSYLFFYIHTFGKTSLIQLVTLFDIAANHLQTEIRFALLYVIRFFKKNIDLTRTYMRQIHTGRMRSSVERL